MGEFFAEISRGMAALYGPEAGEDYLQRASKGIQASMSHPLVDTIAVTDGKRAAGMLMAVAEEEAGRIAFIHVIEAYAGRGLEARLVKEAVRTLRAGGLDGIVSESVPCCALDLGPTYDSLGFEYIERALMIAPLEAATLEAPQEPKSIPCDPSDWEELAGVIVDCYQDHPERVLHLDVRSRDCALAFIAKVASGSYGRSDPGFIRIIRSEGRIVGGLCGSVAAPDVGFVLQVIVHPEHQGRGIGTRLLRETAECFRHAGLTRVGLGVTKANPAYRLYERLGFRPVRTVDAYAWWRA
jgi:ribosomal protein S18 acetylase RimI-like enzyme